MPDAIAAMLNTIDGYEVIDLLVDLAKGGSLHRSPPSLYATWRHSIGKGPEAYPTGTTVDALVTSGLLGPSASDDQNDIEYKLTPRGTQLAVLREGKVAESGEHIWIITYQYQDQQKDYLNIGSSPPDLSRLGQERWEEGIRIMVECRDIRRFPKDTQSFEFI
jgi:hypothetical protein